MSKPKTPKAPEPYSPAWHRARYTAMAEDHGADYRNCPACGWPTHKRYTCRVCGDTDG